MMSAKISITVSVIPLELISVNSFCPMCFILWNDVLNTFENKSPSIIDLERNGSIGSFINSSPILVTLSVRGCSAPIKAKISKDFFRPSVSGFYK